MRVAIFTETYFPYINGVVTHIQILRDGLIKNGHEVLIITADKDVREHIIKDGVLRCPALEFKKIYGYGVASPFSTTLKDLIIGFNPDVIHIQQEFGTGLAGVRLSRSLGIPLIYTLHTMYDDYVYYVAPEPLTEIVKKISHQYIHFIARRADVITGPSKKCVDYLHNAGVKRKVRVIPNSVEVESYSESATTFEQRMAIRDKHNIPHDAFVACFCGRIGKEKGIDNLIKLWKNQTDENMYLIIMGGGPYLEEFGELANQLGIGERVIFTGAMPHEELVPYYATCDVYATASLSEMYSISMLEAQASGLPVIQILDKDNKEQITEGVNGFFFENADQFGESIRKISGKTPEEKVILKAMVRESVKERSGDQIAKYLLELYQLAIDRRAKGILPKMLREDRE